MPDLRFTYEVPIPPRAAHELFVRQTDTWWPKDFTHPGQVLGTLTLDVPVGQEMVLTVAGQRKAWGEILTHRVPDEITWRNWWRQSRRRATTINARFLDVEYGTRFILTHSGWNEANMRDQERFRDWPVILSHFVSAARQHEERLDRFVWA